MNQESEQYLSKRSIQKVFKDSGFAIRKRWGQNFLIDQNTIEKITNRILSFHADTILEIGPGLGAITTGLLDSGKSVVVIERDPFLAKLLLQKKETLEQSKNASSGRLIVLEGDAREFLAYPERLYEKCADEKCEKRVRLISGNLPYYITTELIIGALNMNDLYGGVFLVQKEFAQRVTANSAISSITVFLNNFGSWTEDFSVSGSCFYPEPDVQSSLLIFRPHPEGQRVSREVLQKLLRMSYRGKRKKIRNSWRMGDSLMDPAFLEAQASSIGLDTDLRPEMWNIEDYYKLCNLLI